MENTDLKSALFALVILSGCSNEAPTENQPLATAAQNTQVSPFSIIFSSVT